MTLGALSVTSGAYHRHGAHVPLSFTTFVPHPNSVDFDTIAYYEYLMTDEYSGVDKPAAIIVETTQAEGGIHVAPTPWLRALRQLCDRQGVLYLKQMQLEVMFPMRELVSTVRQGFIILLLII